MAAKPDDKATSRDLNSALHDLWTQQHLRPLLKSAVSLCPESAEAFSAHAEEMRLPPEYRANMKTVERIKRASQKRVYSPLQATGLLLVATDLLRRLPKRTAEQSKCFCELAGPMKQLSAIIGHAIPVVKELEKACATNMRLSHEQMEFTLTGPLRQFTQRDCQILCGSYDLYRFSFAGDPEHGRIATEIVIVERCEDSNLFLNVTWYGFPTFSPYVENKKTKIQTAKTPEIFTGKMHWFGNCVYVQVCHASNLKEQKIRYMLFKYIETPSFVHLGMLCAYASLLTEPVAVKALAVKTSHTPSWSAAKDLSRVRRYEIDPDQKSWQPELKKYPRLLDNRLPKETSSILTVNSQSELLRSIRADTLETIGLPDGYGAEFPKAST